MESKNHWDETTHHIAAALEAYDTEEDSLRLIATAIALNLRVHRGIDDSAAIPVISDLVESWRTDPNPIFTLPMTVQVGLEAKKIL